MNILVISENFNIGGLETHINTYYKGLRNKVNFIFAFPKYKENGYLENAKIYTGFNFGYNSSIKEFCSDVHKLVDIIKEEKIDVVHVHPFYSVYPAIFAANLTNTKLVYTYHGYGSISFPAGINDMLLFMFALESRFNKVFCVSSNVIEYFDSIHNHNAMFLPNFIYEDDFQVHKVSKNKKWAIISRIDSDKYPSIIKFLDIVNNLDIDMIDIYGSGNMEDELKKYISKHKLTKKVFLKGFINNLNKSLDDYTGIIGLGRVIQEALCMNYPAIFIGYGKIAGVVDQKIYKEVKNINFVPATLDDIEISKLQKQIEEINSGKLSKYQFRDEVISDFGVSNLSKYINEIKTIAPESIDIINKIFNDIDNIDDKSDYFYNSRLIFNILYNRLSTYSKNVYFKNLLSDNLRYFLLEDKIDTNLQKSNSDIIELRNIEEIHKNDINSSINNVILDMNKKIDDLSEQNKKLKELLDQNQVLSEELLNYKKGKLYKASTKIYAWKSKFRRKK